MEELKVNKNGFYILDDRTLSYLNGIKNDMQYIGYNSGRQGIKELLKNKANLDTDVKLIDTYDGYKNISELNIFEYTINGDTKFCAELSYQIAGDDYCVETHIFTKRPNRTDIMTVRKINDIEFDIKRGKYKPIFYCVKCGKETHWLDKDGDFDTRLETLENMQCC